MTQASDIVVVVASAAGRAENLEEVLRCMDRQTQKPAAVIVIKDGHNEPTYHHENVIVLSTRKYEATSGLQPRNAGVRAASRYTPDATHVAFLDSDVVVEDHWLESIAQAYALHAQQKRIMVCPYEWLPAGVRPGEESFRAAGAVMNDPRWPAFERYSPNELLMGDLSAGLACFGGNLVWPLTEFYRVGGFWNELSMGRVEDGELGLRAVAMGVGISFCADARGYHLDHPVNMQWKLDTNAREVPMLNARHPWIQGHGVFMVDRDGKAFDLLCPGCGVVIPTMAWWEHSNICPMTS